MDQTSKIYRDARTSALRVLREGVAALDRAKDDEDVRAAIEMLAELRFRDLLPPDLRDVEQTMKRVQSRMGSVAMPAARPGSSFPPARGRHGR